MHNLIRLHGRIDGALLEKFSERFFSIPSGQSVYLHFDSNGGDLAKADEMAALISARKHELEIIGIGYEKVHSSAVHAFVACTYRVDYTFTQYLMHLPKSDGSEIGDRSVDIMLENEIEYLASMTGSRKEVIRQLMHQEVRLTSSQAYMLGITNFYLNKISKFK